MHCLSEELGPVGNLEGHQKWHSAAWGDLAGPSFAVGAELSFLLSRMAGLLVDDRRPGPYLAKLWIGSWCPTLCDHQAVRLAPYSLTASTGSCGFGPRTSSFQWAEQKN